MKVELRGTTANEVASRLERLRLEGGAVALGRVLTLVIVLDDLDLLDEAIDAADAASMEHPCRVIALCKDAGPDQAAEPRQGAESPGDGSREVAGRLDAEIRLGAESPGDGSREVAGRIDAEIRVGADAGASETIILTVPGAMAEQLDTLVNPLLLPDAPIVAWWPGEAPATPADEPIGAMAAKRIVDTLRCSDPVAGLAQAAHGYRPGDVDLSWTRITLWRAQLAAAFEEAGGVSIADVEVTGSPTHPSCYLLLAWLAAALQRPGTFIPEPEAAAITGARIDWEAGSILLTRPDGSDIATLAVSGEVPHEVALQQRTLPECLAEELRRLDPDDVYGNVAGLWSTVIADGSER